MATIADLNYTDDFQPAKKPLLTDLRATLDSMETYINDSIKDNLVQVANDCFGTSYAVDSDGNKNFTNDLFNKQSSANTYTGGDITIATTAAWTDVDASNCKITFTPDYLVGDFKITCIFSLECLTSNATNEIDIRFRLTDGSSPSNQAKAHLITGVNASKNTQIITLTHEFQNMAVSSQTVKLQYFIQTTTANTVKVLASSAAVFYMYVEKV